MTKSTYAEAVDQIQAALRPVLKSRGFRVRGRTFNRETENGLTQVVNLQMGASDPPGTTYIPGLRENLHGLFTVNLGVYVPEVARQHSGSEAKSWVQDYHCCVRARLGEVLESTQGGWWPARPDDAVIGDLRGSIEMAGFPFLERFSTRDKILAEWEGRSENMGGGHPPRIVMALICVGRGERARARALLARQVLETRNPGHPEYVRGLARQLGLGELDG